MLLALWITIAAASQNAREGALIVSAAVSMTEALEEVAAAYRTAGGGPVTFNFAGSNVLARQIVTGAPVDVFISADEMQMDGVDRAGMIASGSRQPIVTNQLVVVEDSTKQPRWSRACV
jgi:molybdate transport system substrate-binding protein